jgi:cobalt-zinc-cadmium efflux system membrane fusion protein
VSGDALESQQPVAEPHVFDVTANVTLPGSSSPLAVRLSKEEGKIELTADQLAKTGVVVQTAGSAKVQAGVQFPGEIRFNEDKTAHVVPRLAGVVESVPANIGQQVKKGQVLAVIASTGLSDQRSELLAAQKRLDLARVTYDREKKLWEQKIFCGARLSERPQRAAGSADQCPERAAEADRHWRQQQLDGTQSLRAARTVRRHDR